MDNVETSAREAEGRALADLDRACSALRAAQAEIDSAVTLARTAGATWAQIGSAMGMTRQAAHERWGHARRGGCQRTSCDCPQHELQGCPCGHGPGKGYRASPVMTA